jgi:branched-chain amino acid transport system substrate-binding protein
MKKLLLVVIALVSFVTCTYAASGVIKIGSLWPMTGPGAAWGLPFHNVIEWQADQINAAGGINVAGKYYQIEIIKEDSKYSPAVARKAAEKLIYQDGVKFILGPLGGGPLNAITPLLNQNKVINVVVVNAANAIGPDKPYGFRAFMGTGEIYVAFVEYFVESHGVKTIQLVDWDVESARAAANDFLYSCKALGITCPKPMLYPRDTKDFYPVMTKAIDKKPDMIIVGGAPALQALSAKAARELGYKGLLGNPTPTTADRLTAVVDKKFLEGYFTNAFIDSGPLVPAGVKKFREQWEASGNKWAKTGGPVAANYLPLILQGMQAAGSVDDTDKIKVAMEKMEYNSPVFGFCQWGGKERYGINHLTVYPVHITRIKNGADTGAYVIPAEKIKPVVLPK